MIFERIEAAGLSHYSYVIGCPADGRMVVVDPKRDIQAYIDFARDHRMSISHILETHIHADYASGARELAEQTGASVWASGYDEGETFEVAFPHTDVFDGDTLDIGAVRLVAVHTPGHTPEHLSFLLYDRSRSESTPMAMLTGDFLFIGSLGRPDLLGEQAKRDLARKLFHSVREVLKPLPDGLEIHPAHGAGSMCGAGMSGRPISTLGYERSANPYLDPSLTEDQFIERILGTVPPFPGYYKRMKRINSEGAHVLDGLPGQSPLSVAQVQQQLDDGAIVIDLRDQISFAKGHISGSFGIGGGTMLPIWASWVVPYDTPIVLLSDEPAMIADAATHLIRVGLDDVAGYLDGGWSAWQSAGGAAMSYDSIQPRELLSRLESGEPLHVIDVRSDNEWNNGHIDGALHFFGGEIEKHLDQLPEKDAPLVMVCGGGYRSTVAASVLLRHGYTNITNMVGGMGAWRKHHLPEVKPTQHAPQVTA